MLCDDSVILWLILTVGLVVLLYSLRVYTGIIDPSLNDQGWFFLPNCNLYYYSFWVLLISKMWKMSFVGLLFQGLEMQEIEVMEPKVLIACMCNCLTLLTILPPFIPSSITLAFFTSWKLFSTENSVVSFLPICVLILVGPKLCHHY